MSEVVSRDRLACKVKPVRVGGINPIRRYIAKFISENVSPDYSSGVSGPRSPQQRMNQSKGSLTLHRSSRHAMTSPSTRDRDMYINRAAMPSSELSLADVFESVDVDGDRRVRVAEELPFALEVLGLPWNDECHNTLLQEGLDGLRRFLRDVKSGQGIEFADQISPHNRQRSLSADYSKWTFVMKSAHAAASNNKKSNTHDSNVVPQSEKSNHMTPTNTFMNDVKASKSASTFSDIQSGNNLVHARCPPPPPRPGHLRHNSNDDECYVKKVGLSTVNENTQDSGGNTPLLSSACSSHSRSMSDRVETSVATPHSTCSAPSLAQDEVTNHKSNEKPVVEYGSYPKHARGRARTVLSPGFIEADFLSDSGEDIQQDKHSKLSLETDQGTSRYNSQSAGSPLLQLRSRRYRKSVRMHHREPRVDFAVFCTIVNMLQQALGRRNDSRSRHIPSRRRRHTYISPKSRNTLIRPWDDKPENDTSQQEHNRDLSGRIRHLRFSRHSIHVGGQYGRSRENAHSLEQENNVNKSIQAQCGMKTPIESPIKPISKSPNENNASISGDMSDKITFGEPLVAATHSFSDVAISRNKSPLSDESIVLESPLSFSGLPPQFRRAYSVNARETSGTFWNSSRQRSTSSFSERGDTPVADNGDSIRNGSYSGGCSPSIREQNDNAATQKSRLSISHAISRSSKSSPFPNSAHDESLATQQQISAASATEGEETLACNTNLLNLTRRPKSTSPSSLRIDGSHMLQSIDSQSSPTHATTDNVHSAQVAQTYIDTPELGEVFLGGACNPTTWRRDVAIPILEEANISYYNPQVDDWSPSLIALEARAKEEALVLLFVVTSETRGVASMVEIAELVTAGRAVILVLQDIHAQSRINGQALSSDEIKDLNRGRAYLADVADRHGVMVYQNIRKATQEAIARIQKYRRNRQA